MFSFCTQRNQSLTVISCCSTRVYLPTHDKWTAKMLSILKMLVASIVSAFFSSLISIAAIEVFLFSYNLFSTCSCSCSFSCLSNSYHANEHVLSSWTPELSHYVHEKYIFPLCDMDDIHYSVIANILYWLYWSIGPMCF